MGFWTNRQHRTALDDAEDLAYAPSGGGFTKWFVGVGVALIPIAYGVHCFMAGETRFFGRAGSSLDLRGSGAIALAVAYIAVGAFIHFHWFWGLIGRLEPFSYLLKCLAVLVFLGGFGYAIYRIIT
jgi:hypothetical protein